jgi:hypothetical protein
MHPPRQPAVSGDGSLVGLRRVALWEDGLVVRVGTAIIVGALVSLVVLVAGLLLVSAAASGMPSNLFFVAIFALCGLGGLVGGTVARWIGRSDPSVAAFGAWVLWGSSLAGLLLWRGPGELDAPPFLTIALLVGLIGTFVGRAPWRDVH